MAVWYKEFPVCEVFLEQQLVEEPSMGAVDAKVDLQTQRANTQFKR